MSRAGDEPHAQCSCSGTQRSSASLAGVGLIVVGALLLLQNEGYLAEGQQLWGLICYGLASIAGGIALARYRAAGRFTPAVLSAAGATMFLAFLGSMLFFDLPWSTLWPMLLIIPGVIAVIGASATRDAGRYTQLPR
jgi:MYXO-CTERM domain-containing protein